MRLHQLEELRLLSDSKLEEAGYKLPITPDSQPETNSAHFKKQLALKEQDLAYALKRAETLQAAEKSLQ